MLDGSYTVVVVAAAYGRVKCLYFYTGVRLNVVKGRGYVGGVGG